MSDEKMIQGEPKFCVDCEYYNGKTEAHDYTCEGRPDARDAIFGETRILNAHWERMGMGTDNPVTSSYEPCGPGAKHWKAKEEG